jgi:hypothetical protein
MVAILLIFINACYKNTYKMTIFMKLADIKAFCCSLVVAENPIYGPNFLSSYESRVIKLSRFFAIINHPN